MVKKIFSSGNVGREKGESYTPPMVSCGTRVFVLKCLLKNISSPLRIGRLAGKDAKTIRYHLKKLLGSGLVMFDCSCWSLSEAGKNFLFSTGNKGREKKCKALPTYVSSGSEGIIKNKDLKRIKKSIRNRGREVDTAQGGVTETLISSGSQVRLHKVWLNMGVLDLNFEIFGDRKPVVLRSGAFYFDVRVGEGLVRLWSNGRVMCKLPSFWGGSVDAVEKELKRYVLGWIPLVGERLGIVFVRKGSLSVWRLSQGEIAFVNHAFAKKCQARKFKLKVKDKDGKLWLLSDLSLGDPELEVVDSKKFREDAHLIENFFNEVRAGRWKDLNLGLVQVADTVKNLTGMQLRIVKVLKDRGVF